MKVLFKENYGSVSHFSQNGKKFFNETLITSFVSVSMSERVFTAFVAKNTPIAVYLAKELSFADDTTLVIDIIEYTEIKVKLTFL